MAEEKKETPAPTFAVGDVVVLKGSNKSLRMCVAELHREKGVRCQWIDGGAEGTVRQVGDAFFFPQMLEKVEDAN